MPIQETLSKFNWIDIVLLCLILTTCYKGSQKGFVIEIFKLLGLILAIYVSLHYFSSTSDYLVKSFPALGVVFSDFVCFIVLAIVSYLALVTLRSAFCHLFKVEAAKGLERWGGLVLGFLRGLFVSSLLMIIFCLLAIPYLKASIHKSYLGSRLVFTDVKVYESLFNGIVSKFSPQEKLNKDIYEVLEE